MKIRGHVSAALILLFTGIIGGAFAYHYIEGWNILNSFYFVIVTITTIGYGDFAPHTATGKIFTLFYSFFGVGIALYVFSTVNSAIFKKHVKEKVSQIKRDVKKEQEIKEKVKTQLRRK